VVEPRRGQRLPAGTHGYNVLDDTCDPMDDDTLYGGHGTHVAGIIGAAGNNGVGVAGVSWTVRLLAVKWVGSDGTGFTSDLISAVDWVVAARKAGVAVRVVNDSATWSGDAYSQALSDEIDELTASNILFVTASGNSAMNTDAVPRYPCSYSRPGQLCVAASDQTDHLWTNSDWGASAVDLAAPGVDIYSTLRAAGTGSSAAARWRARRSRAPPPCCCPRATGRSRRCGRASSPAWMSSRRWPGWSPPAAASTCARDQRLRADTGAPAT